MRFFSHLRERQKLAAIAPLLAPSRWKLFGQKLLDWRGVLIAAPVMAGLVIALRSTGSLQLLEWAALDQFFRLRPAETADPRLVIVGINEQDIQKLGRWPPSDAVLAEVLEQIRRQQPRAIGLDIVRDFPVEPGHQKLVDLFETTPNLIGIETFGESEDSAIAPPPLLKRKDQVGFNDLVVDGDNKLRRGLLTLQIDGKRQFSFSLRLALLYLQPQGISLTIPTGKLTYLQLGQTIFPRFQSEDGGYVRADAGGFQILLNPRGPAGSFQTISLDDVLENRIPPDFLRDRIVLIGATAVSLRDFFSTSYSGTAFNLAHLGNGKTPEQTAGVEIHATIISQLLNATLEDRPLIRVWAEPLEWLWILVWSYLGAVLIWFLRSPYWTTIAIFLVGAALAGITFLAFLLGWWLPLVPPLLALFSSGAVLTAYIATLERQERQTVMNLFERHVTREIAETIWRDRRQFLQKGRLPGRRMTATVLFSDLKNFTPIAEHTNPEVLMSWLNEYLEAMAQIVVAHGGVVDKFIGDSVMAVFGVPIPRTTPEAITEDACRAVRCALVMAGRLEQLNQLWQTEGLPNVTMRVGISTGTVVTGSLGGLQKLDYTTIGDSVNVAARLESYDKCYEKTLKTGVCRILINEETYGYIQGKFPTQFIDSEQLRGREQITKIYQVLLS